MMLGLSPGTAKEPAQRPALLWPLEVPGVLLSSFGEYRYDHLHAGLDISTEGGTGYKVFAADQGLIYRLKVEWRGYGRALYLRHPGGRISVYGHLERFEDSTLGLERRVANRQAQARTRYPGDIYIDPPLPVRRGQVIAYSGESGVGLPHLHFELRERDDQPLDPFAAGLRPPADHRPPVLESVTMTSADPASVIDGTLRERTLRLVRRGGVFTTDRAVRLSGPFLAVLSAYDPVGSSGRSGVHAIEATLDGRPVYELTFRTFRFDQYPQSGLIYDHTLSHLGPSKYAYRLFRLPGNDLAGSSATGNGEMGGERLMLDATPGPHRLEISVGDEAGNISRARVDLLVGAVESSAPQPTPTSAVSNLAGGDAPLVVGWPRFLEILLPRSLASDSALLLEAGGGQEMLARFLPRDDSYLSAAVDYARAARSPGLSIVTSVEPRKEVARVPLQTRFVTRAQGDVLRTGEMEITLPPKSRFYDGPFVVRRNQATVPPGLVAVGSALDLLPFGDALDQPSTMTFRLDEATAAQVRALGIYRFDPDLGRWGYEGGDLDPSGRTITLRFHRYGRFALLRDAMPPVLVDVRPGDGARHVGRQPHFLARVEEVGMGLNFDGVSFNLDGAPLESEFDPDHGQSQPLMTPTLAPGWHRLRVTAIDRAGNASAPVEVSFEVR